MDETTQKPTSKRRWLQFGLRELLLLAVVLSGCDSGKSPWDVTPPTRRVELEGELPPDYWTAVRCVGVVDGDTIDIIDADNQQQRIRLAGIDTPERGQPFFRRAKQFTSDLVFGKQVELAGDEQDRWGRRIAGVKVDGQDVGLALVRAGYAWHYKQYSDDPELAAAEQQARAAKLELWGDSQQPIPPWEWRKRK